MISKIEALSPQQVPEVMDFVRFLAVRSAKRAGFDRLLAIAAAVAGGSELIMSGDNDLLGIGGHRGIGIVLAAEAVGLVEVSGRG